MRLDVFLKESGLVNSRTKAQELIKTSNIKIDGIICTDIKKELEENFDKNRIEIVNNIKYVGRGGEKLEHAIKYFNIKAEAKVCLDIGSSTGGFTQVLLENKAKQVFSIDVGSDQFDKNLLEKYKAENKDRIKLFEKTDIRNFGKDIENAKNIYFEFFDLVVCDVSFISITKIVKNIYELLKEGGEGVILIKPQFEVGKENIGKGGLVKSGDESIDYEDLISSMIENIKKVFTENNLKVIDISPSPITGGDGNIEFLMHIKK